MFMQEYTPRFILYLFMHMCIFACGYVHMSVCALRSQKMMSDPLLQMAVVLSTWVQGTELGCSTRAASTLNHWAVIPAPIFLNFVYIYICVLACFAWNRCVCAWWLQDPEESIGSPRTGVTDIVSCHGGAENWPRVLLFWAILPALHWSNLSWSNSSPELDFAAISFMFCQTCSYL